MKKHVTVSLLACGLLAGAPVQSEVEHHRISDSNMFTKVSDDSWKPADFVNGTPVPATYFAQTAIVLDGIGDEPAWAATAEVKLALSHGSVSSVMVKALYTDNDIYFQVRWPDASEDRDHRPWTWDAELEQYVEGPQIEDSILLSFEAGCDWMPSLLSGYVYDFDGWHWRAARSDPFGQAWDLAGTIQDQEFPGLGFKPYPARHTEPFWNVKFTDDREGIRYNKWNELERMYLFNPATESVYFRAPPDRLERSELIAAVPPPASPPVHPGLTWPQYPAVELSGDAGDVSAKGHWEDGYWTVEFHRSLVTLGDTVTDSEFERLTQFSIHVFDQVDSIDRSSESERLFLQFLPEKQYLVKD